MRGSTPRTCCVSVGSPTDPTSSGSSVKGRFTTTLTITSVRKGKGPRPGHQGKTSQAFHPRLPEPSGEEGRNAALLHHCKIAFNKPAVCTQAASPSPDSSTAWMKPAPSAYCLPAPCRKIPLVFLMTWRTDPAALLARVGVRHPLQNNPPQLLGLLLRVKHWER